VIEVLIILVLLYKRHVNDWFIKDWFRTGLFEKPMPARLHLKIHCPFLPVIYYFSLIFDLPKRYPATPSSIFRAVHILYVYTCAYINKRINLLLDKIIYVNNSPTKFFAYVSQIFIDVEIVIHNWRG